MSKTTIIIPSKNEIFLQKTIDDILEKASGDVEIICILDGYWSDPPIKDDPRVRIIHFGEGKGMRSGINAGAAIATGEYLMKCDGHCLFEKGFDEKLKADCEDNWLVVPRRYALDAEKWERAQQKPDYMYLTPPYDEPADKPQFWERGMKGKEWREYGYKEDAKEKEIDDLMTFQGSCYFLPKKLFEKIGGMDTEVFGEFSKEAQEIGTKVWLSGGRCVRNKKTFYAHLHKGRKMGRGYFLSGETMAKGDIAARDLWMHNKWEGQQYDFSALLEKFSPMPEWNDYYLNQFKKHDKYHKKLD